MLRIDNCSNETLGVVAETWEWFYLSGKSFITMYSVYHMKDKSSF